MSITICGLLGGAVNMPLMSKLSKALRVAWTIDTSVCVWLSPFCPRCLNSVITDTIQNSQLNGVLRLASLAFLVITVGPRILNKIDLIVEMHSILNAVQCARVNHQGQANYLHMSCWEKLHVIYTVQD